MLSEVKSLGNWNIRDFPVSIFPITAPIWPIHWLGSIGIPDRSKHGDCGCK